MIPNLSHAAFPTSNRAVLDPNKSMLLQPASIRQHVDQLYDQACVRYTTYDTMVSKGFSESMREAFSEDEQADEKTMFAFKYARERYGYLSIDEQEQLDEELADDGYCTHGLTWMTCPCGCFEGD